MGAREQFLNWLAVWGSEEPSRKNSLTGCWWLISAILATWEAEIGRIMVQGQPGQIVGEFPSSK
jgi:hypothetical protein